LEKKGHKVKLVAEEQGQIETDISSTRQVLAEPSLKKKNDTKKTLKTEADESPKHEEDFQKSNTKD